MDSTIDRAHVQLWTYKNSKKWDIPYNETIQEFVSQIFLIQVKMTSFKWRRRHPKILNRKMLVGQLCAYWHYWKLAIQINLNYLIKNKNETKFRTSAISPLLSVQTIASFFVEGSGWATGLFIEVITAENWALCPTLIIHGLSCQGQTLLRCSTHNRGQTTKTIDILQKFYPFILVSD